MTKLIRNENAQTIINKILITQNLSFIPGLGHFFYLSTPFKNCFLSKTTPLP